MRPRGRAFPAPRHELILTRPNSGHRLPRKESFMTTITHEQPVAAANKQPVAAANNKPATAPPPTTADNSAPIPVSGILDIGDGRAFVRTSGYRTGRDDVYVSAGQVRQYGLRQGDQIAGAARQAGQSQAGQSQAGQSDAGQGAGQGGGD